MDSLFAPLFEDAKATSTKFCDSCWIAAQNDGAESEIIPDVLLTLGADIADHYCDAVENGEPSACHCGCH